MRLQKRSMQEMELEDKRWKIGQLNLIRGLYFGLQANQELPLTKAEQKKGANDGKIKEIKQQMLEFIEEFQQALSHPWHYEEYMGLPHSFEAPEGAVSRYVQQSPSPSIPKAQKTGEKAGEKSKTPEDIKKHKARAIEQSIMDKLSRIVDKTGGGTPVSELSASNPIGQPSEN